jgi:hypothetical protein
MYMRIKSRPSITMKLMRCVRRKGLFAIAILVSCSVVPGKEWYVAPDGTAGGDGSRERPWSLEAALKPDPRIQPMDTVWVRKGVYNGAFVSRLKGAPGRPVVLRAYPGERVVLDGRGFSPKTVLTIEGEWAWYWGLEITNTDPNRNSNIPGNNNPEDRGGGISMAGPNIKVINCIVHNTGTAVGQSKNIPDMELYGTVIFNNGWRGPDRQHGPGIYTQNSTGEKVLRENIIFNSYWSNLQLYGSSSSALNNFRLEGNVNFNGRWLVGGGAPLKNITAIENMLYGNTAEFSYTNRANENLVLRRNYFPVFVSAGQGWDRVRAEGNTFLRPGNGGTLLGVTISEGHTLQESSFSGNTYLVSQAGQAVASVLAPGMTAAKAYRFAEWQEAGFDKDGRLEVVPNGVPREPKVFVRRNEYEPQRAHVVIYNWPKLDAVDVDISALNPQPGDRWVLRNVQNYFEEFETGIYEGKPLRVRMTGWTAAAPIGEDKPLYPATFPEFGVFVLTLERGQGVKTALAADPERAGAGAPGALLRTELPGSFYPGEPVAGSEPYGEELAGVRVHVTDSEGRQAWARLAALTREWVAWEAPEECARGWARVRLIRVGEPEVEAGGVVLEKAAPDLFTADGSGRGLALGYVRYGDGRAEPLVRCDAAGCRGEPVDASAEEVVLMGTGFRGAAGWRARVGAVEDVEAAAEADCCYPGLDWVRVRWPAGVAGEVGVKVAAQGDGSNEVVVRGR